MKYYNFDTIYRSLKDILCDYLKEKKINYELSGALAGWHFEILTDPRGAAAIELFIEKNLLWEA